MLFGWGMTAALACFHGPAAFAPSAPSLLTEAGRRQAAIRLAAAWKRAIERSAELGYVAHACAELGLRRTAFYRVWKAHRRGGEQALYEAAMRSVERSAQLAAEIDEAVLAETKRHPDWGRHRIAKSLRARGVAVTPRRVWGVWQRHEMLRPERAPGRRTAETVCL